MIKEQEPRDAINVIASYVNTNVGRILIDGYAYYFIHHRSNINIMDDLDYSSYTLDYLLSRSIHDNI